MRHVLALALLAALGCGGRAETDGPTITSTQQWDIAGSYALKTIASTPLPAQYPPGRLITSSQLVVRADGTWTEALSFVTAGKTELAGWTGTWTQSFSGVAFRVGPTTLYSGVATTNGFQLNSGSTAFTYQRD